MGNKSIWLSNPVIVKHLIHVTTKLALDWLFTQKNQHSFIFMSKPMNVFLNNGCICFCFVFHLYLLWGCLDIFYFNFVCCTSLIWLTFIWLVLCYVLWFLFSVVLFINFTYLLILLYLFYFVFGIVAFFVI